MSRKSTAAAVADEQSTDTAPDGISVRFRSELSPDDPEALRRFAAFLSVLQRSRRRQEAEGRRFVDSEGNPLDRM